MYIVIIIIGVNIISNTIIELNDVGVVLFVTIRLKFLRNYFNRRLGAVIIISLQFGVTK